MPRAFRRCAVLILLWSAGVSPSLTAGQSDARFFSALTEGRRQTVVTYGTSLTANSSWPRHLEKTLRQTFGRKARVINAAEGGKNSRWGLANVGRRVTRRRPDAVFIEFSINDALESSKLSVEESAWNLEQMIGRVRATLPRCEIILLIMNPPTGEQLEKRFRYREYEQVYRDAAADHGCGLIDFSTDWSHLIEHRPDLWESLTPDDIHPDDRAIRLITLPRLFREIGFRPDSALSSIRP